MKEEKKCLKKKSQIQKKHTQNSDLKEKIAPKTKYVLKGWHALKTCTLNSLAN